MADDTTLSQVLDHYQKGTDDNDTRRTRENGWNDVIKAYFGHKPDSWPYLAMVSDPVIRTTILEKTSRLFNGRLRGQLVPREGGDILKAKINNALLEYQWDAANNGGSMLEKWALMDIQTRLFGASFALIYWRVDKNKDELMFEGNEMKVLDNRDVWVDFAATHIRNANWVQVREWKQIADLKAENEDSPEPLYKNLDELEVAIREDRASKGGGERRDTKYESQVKQLRGLEDRVGEDSAFPVIEVVTEYRNDRWITFVPRYSLIIRDIENPYDHGRIPVVQLRYYPIGDDVYGESEVEPVLPISRAIDALLCGAIDEVNLRMKPPLKISNNETVRMDTIQYGPNALWLVGKAQSNVEQLQTGGEVINNFTAMYSSLKSAYQNAMGELSQGTSNVDPLDSDKTATEIRQVARQQLSRDQYNQMYLEQALKDQMMLWVANNQQFLFTKPGKHTHVVRILGRETLKDLQEAGLDQTRLDSDGLVGLEGILSEASEDEVDQSVIDSLLPGMEVPRYPVVKNPQVSDPSKLEIVPKLQMDEDSEGGFLHLVSDDLGGYYDYIPSVTSMAANADEVRKQGRERAMQTMLLPAVQQQLQMEGQKAKIKELLVQVLEDNGISNAEKFFESAEQAQPGGIPEANAGAQAFGANPAAGMGGAASPNIGGGESPVSQSAGF